MTNPADIADLFAPAPAGAAQGLRYRQGTIVTFDPVTLENTVSVGGATMTNLPLLGVAEAASLAPGAVVGLHLIGNEQGSSTWVIVGRIVTPGSAEATAAITQLGQKVASNSVPTNETTSSTSFTDLATRGPEVSILVGASGKVLVFVTAYMFIEVADDGLGNDAQMSFALSGANTRTAQDVFDAGAGTEVFWLAATNGADFVGALTVQHTALALLESLTPGMTTFTAKYANVTGAGKVAEFSFRNLTVFAL